MMNIQDALVKMLLEEGKKMGVEPKVDIVMTPYPAIRMRIGKEDIRKALLQNAPKEYASLIDVQVEGDIIISVRIQ
jgi:hypothetical protein